MSNNQHKIGENMKKILFAVLMVCVMFFVCSLSHASDISLGWDASASSDVAGYRIFQRLEGEVYNYQLPVAEVDANTLCTTIHDISDGSNVYFVCRAFDIHNLESINSNEVNDKETGPPLPPGTQNGGLLRILQSCLP